MSKLMREFGSVVGMIIESFGVGWQFAAIIGGLSTGLWAIGFAIWFVGLALYIGAML
jgi:hypothetical protein